MNEETQKRIDNLLIKKIEILNNIIIEYGQHKPACTKFLARQMGRDATCSCGFDDHMLQAEKIEKV